MQLINKPKISPNLKFLKSLFEKSNIFDSISPLFELNELGRCIDIPSIYKYL